MDHHQCQVEVEVVAHVLLFPLPLQSPVNTMLQLAEILCLKGIHVTFLNTEHNHQRLLRCTNVQSRFAQYSGLFQFKTIPDGLPQDNPRTVDQFEKIVDSLQSIAVPFLQELLQLGSPSDSGLPITCVIADGLLFFALNIAKERGIPFFFFETISPCTLWTYLCIPMLIESGEVPVLGDDLDLQVKSIPGMEGFLRRRDLSHVFRGNNMLLLNFNHCLREVQSIPSADGLILNSFEALDGPVLSYIRSGIPNLYTIGPLQLHLRARLASQTTFTTTHLGNLSNSFLEEDRKCISWLDEQPPNSVLYVSFGSLNQLTMEEFTEYWHGITNSGERFLWVIRPDSIKGQQMDQDEFLMGLLTTSDNKTQGKGLILNWVPQEEVLSHPATAAFLTHSGWNSTLESIIAGVPMICWPQYVDQLVTSRYVEEVWKIGLDMKDTCERSIIEKMVKDVMKRKNRELSQSVQMMSILAKESVSREGSSYSGLDRLVEDINIKKNLKRKKLRWFAGVEENQT